MKTTSRALAILVMLTLSACEIIDTGFYRKARSECLRPGSLSPEGRASNGSVPDHPPDSLKTEPDKDVRPGKKDTIIYYSIVCFNSDYDWQRDTAYGAADYKIALYRAGAEAFTIHSGAKDFICPDPDMHHIIGGHLYTENSTPTQTVIGVDGTELLRFNGREYLKGLLVDGGDVYTLSQSRSGQGFTFRKNGVAMYSSDKGRIFGSFSEPSYGENGALYMDDGKCCFCYSHKDNGVDFNHVICDGVEVASPMMRGLCAMDVRRIHSSDKAVTAIYQGRYFDDARIWPEEEGFSVSGHMRDSYSGSAYSGVLPPPGGLSTELKLCDGEAVIYHGEQSDFAVCADDSGFVCVYSRDGNMMRSREPSSFLTPACAAICGEKLVIALSPKKKSAPPVLMTGEEAREIGINGYVSCVSVIVIPAN